MSSVPIVYRKGDVIFKIDIKYISGERQKLRDKHQRICSLHSCGHDPHILVLKKFRGENLYNPIKKGEH